MNKSSFVLMLLLAILGSSLAFGADYPLTVTDSAGREVTFDGPVDGIIVMSTDGAEAVTVLGAADRVVGISDSVKKKGYYFPRLRDKQSIGKWNEPDYEMIGEIAKSGGEILLISYSYPDKPYGVFGIEKGASPFRNIKVVALEFFKPENMTHEIDLLGQILEEEENAQDYLDWYENRMSDVDTAVRGLNKPRVYVEWSSKGDLSTLGSGSGFDQVLGIANGFNIAGGLGDSYPKVGWEWVISENPEVIIKRESQSSDQKEIGWKAGPSQDTVKLEGIRNEILVRPGASGLSAVKSNKVYVVDWDIMNGLDQVVGLTYLANLLHSNADLKPEEVHKEYLQFLGLEYKEGRIFVYPETKDG